MEGGGGGGGTSPNGPDARKDADERSDENPNKAIQEVNRGQGYGKSI